jgi:hypothetical protein
VSLHPILTTHTQTHTWGEGVISKLKGQISKTQIKNKNLINSKPDMVPDDLDRLLAKITKDNLHGEFNTGATVGQKEW